MKSMSYYEASDLVRPIRPVKPQPPRVEGPYGPNPNAVRMYADELEAYEKDMKSYDSNMEYYKDTIVKRRKEFYEDTYNDYVGVEMNKAQFDVIFSRAQEEGSSEGFYRVRDLVSEYYDMISLFNSKKDK